MFDGDGSRTGSGDDGTAAPFEDAPLRAALDASMDGIAVADADGTFRYVNEAYASMHGYDDPSVLEGSSWEPLYAAVERERFEDTVVPELRRTGEWRGDATGRRADGSTFPQELSLASMGDGRYVCVVRDISARRRRRERLERLHRATTELMYADDEEAVGRLAVDVAESVFDRTLTACWLYDSAADTLRSVAASDAVRELASSAGSAGELPGIDAGSFEMRVFERGDSRLVRDYDEVPTGEATTDAPLGTVLMLPLGDHGVFHVAARETDAVSAEERYLLEILARHLETALDLLERERELERQNDRLESFAGVVSHDLRNPLSVAAGRIELARDTGDLDHLENARAAVDRMGDIVDEVLTLARQGDDIGATEAVSLDTVARDAWRTVETGDEATLAVESDATVEADPGRLRTLFENLFRNAVEHGSTGSRTGSDDAVEHGPDADEGDGATLSVRVVPTDDGFFVADDGPGFDAADPFEHGYSTSDSGTGFGLSIVEAIAEAHGWTVAAGESAAGGATVEFGGVGPDTG